MSNNTRKANNNVMKVLVMVVVFWAIVSLACSGGDGGSGTSSNNNNKPECDTQCQIQKEVERINQELPKAVDNAANTIAEGAEKLDELTDDVPPLVDLQASPKNAAECVTDPLNKCGNLLNNDN